LVVDLQQQVLEPTWRIRLEPVMTLANVVFGTSLPGRFLRKAGSPLVDLHTVMSLGVVAMEDMNEDKGSRH
jgi:hypothetical protein